MRMQKTGFFIGLGAALIAGAVSAQEVELPDSITVTAYDTSSSTYAQAVSISNMLTERYDTSFRIIPGKNDVSRMLLMQVGRADFCACGISAFFGQEGTAFFANQGGGPIKIRMMLSNEGDLHLGVGSATDSGVDSPADLAGKRVAFVEGGPANNFIVESILAYGGLTWDDVEIIRFPSSGAAVEGIINGQVDAAAMNTAAGIGERLANSPRGLTWVQTNHDDTEAWARLNSVAPFMQPRETTRGIGVPEGGIDGSGYAFPYWVTLEENDSDYVYNLTKAMFEGSDGFIMVSPRMAGYALEYQNLKAPIPYHDGAVRFFREAGIWGEEEQAHNDKLIARQDVLAAAWDEMLTFDGSDEEFEERWVIVRADALTSVGMLP